MYGFCDGYKYAPLAKHNRTTLLKLDTDRQNCNFAVNCFINNHYDLGTCTTCRTYLQGIDNSKQVLEHDGVRINA